MSLLPLWTQFQLQEISSGNLGPSAIFVEIYLSLEIFAGIRAASTSLYSHIKLENPCNNLRPFANYIAIYGSENTLREFGEPSQFFWTRELHREYLAGIWGTTAKFTWLDWIPKIPCSNLCPSANYITIYGSRNVSREFITLSPFISIFEGYAAGVWSPSTI